MDSNNWRQPEQPPAEAAGGDWRLQLQHDSRQRIVDKITDTLKLHIPPSGQEGVQEVRKIAMRFEEKIYHEATSQSDYLRMISFKMLSMVSKFNSPGAMPNATPSNSAGMSRNLQDPEQLPVEGAGGYWRLQLQHDSRQKIVDKIMDTMKRHLPSSGQEGVQELRKIAMRYEEKIYNAATSQSDYLRKISLKMITMESKSDPPGAMPNAIPSNSTE